VLSITTCVSDELRNILVLIQPICADCEQSQVNDFFVTSTIKRFWPAVLCGPVTNFDALQWSHYCQILSVVAALSCCLVSDTDVCVCQGCAVAAGFAAGSHVDLVLSKLAAVAKEAKKSSSFLDFFKVGFFVSVLALTHMCIVWQLCYFTFLCFAYFCLYI